MSRRDTNRLEIAFRARRARLRSALSEAQGHRCPICFKKVDAKTSPVIKIDREGRVNYQNAVLLCETCGGSQANYSSLMYYYEVGRHETKAQKPVYPESKKIIRDIVARKCTEAKIPFSDFYLQKDIIYCPPDKTEEVADRIFTVVEKLEKLYKSDKYIKKRIKIRVSEAQNHRCCYCGYSFTFLEKKNTPRFPTWEHVIDNNCEEERTDTLDNLVIACNFCNCLRGKTHWPAEVFYDWVANNRDIINEIADQGWDNYMDIVRLTKVYAHEHGFHWGARIFKGKTEYIEL